MDKSKGRNVKGSKSHHPFPGSGELIALGSKSGSGQRSGLSAAPEAPTRPHVKTSSSLASGGDRKREPTSSTSGVPPSKKSRLGVSSSSTKSSSSSSSSKHGSKSVKRDPLDLSNEVNPTDFIPERFFAVFEKADKSGDFAYVENLIAGAAQRLKSNKDKDNVQLCENLLLAAKTFPPFFQNVSVQEAFCSVVNIKKSAGLEFKIKGTSSGPFSTVALTVLALSLADAQHWPISLVQLWIEDACGERAWVDLPHFKTLIDNFLCSFGTLLPASSLLPPSDGGLSGGAGGSSPLPSHFADDPSLQEKIAGVLEDYKLDIPVMNRYASQEMTVEGIVTDHAADIIHKKAPEIPKNVLKCLSFACGLSAVRAFVVCRVEQWLHNGKSGRQAQELLLHLCLNANCNTSSDAEVVTQISKLRMKTKPLLHFYSIALREMVRDNDTNLRNVLNQIIYNELSPSRNPNNWPLLGPIISGVPESREVLADVFIDLLQKREDFHPALRLILREIVRAARFECDLTKFVNGLMKKRDITWAGEIRERAFAAITDLILLSMFLSVSPQVKEAFSVAAARGEPKDIPTLNNFRNLVGAIQEEAVEWMYTTVLTMFRPQKKEFCIALNKILLKDPVNDLMTKEGWPAESEKNLFSRLCLEMKLQENTLVFTLMMGLSKDHQLSPSEALDLVENAICKSALHKTGLLLEKIQIIELLFRLTEYKHPENIVLPTGYEPPKLAITNFYWRVWTLLCIICAHNPLTFGKVGWADYPTLKVLMEMCMTNHFSYPTASSVESTDELISRELQTAAMEKEEILEFESHLAAVSSKTSINERTSLLLSQLMRMDPFGSARTPPAPVLAQLQNWNEQMILGHQLCRSRNPDFLLDLIQRNSEPMPWLSRLVSEGSFEILPVQCLCEFMMGHMEELGKAVLSRNSEEVERSPRKQLKGTAELSKEDTKLLHLLHHLQEIIHGSAEDSEAREVLEYFFRRLSSPKMQNRSQALQALQMLLTSEEKGGAEDHWLLDCLPTLKIFSDIQGSLLLLLRQAIQVENEPVWVTRYMDFLSTWAQLSEDCDMEGLAMDVAQLVVERNGLISMMISKHPKCFESLFDIFSNYMKKIREPHKETYKWSESQDQVLVQWTAEGLEATMNILVIHAIVILLSSYSPQGSVIVKGRSGKGKDLKYNELLDIWFPKSKENCPKGFLLNTSEEAILFPDWIKLRMIRSDNSRLLTEALQELEADQLMLFIQHFGVPVQSMTALLYCLDKVTEQKEDQLVQSVVNAPYMHTLVQLQWKRGASGGEKFVHLLKTRCGVQEEMELSKEKEMSVPVRLPLQIPSSRESSKSMLKAKSSHSPSAPRLFTHKGSMQSSFVKDKDRKTVEELSKEILHLSLPSSNRRRSSVPTTKGGDSPGSLRRHSSHLEGREEDMVVDEEPCPKYLGELVDTLTEVEPCIVRNALEYQLPLVFGRNESQSNCRPFLMTALAHAGWETVERCLNLFLKEFDSTYDPSSVLDLIYATHTNPKLWQGIGKCVPKHQRNLSVLHLTHTQLTAMAEYIVEEISQLEMKGTKFSISNLLGPVQPVPVRNLKTSKKGLQNRARLWLECCQQERSLVDGVIQTLMERKGKNPCTKKFVCQVYVEFPEIILIDNWKWKAEEMSLTEDEISSVLDTISHGLITAIANTQNGKDWARKSAHDYEICLRKLASLHPTLLIRQLPLMGTLLEGRVHLEPSVFHQQNHNLPFVVYLALFDLMQPHILKHFKTLKPTLLLYIKLFKNYGIQKDYSSSLSRFATLLHNLLSTNPQEVKEFLNPHYTSLRELSSVKYYIDVVPLQNLIGSLVPPSGPSVSQTMTNMMGGIGGTEPSSFLSQSVSSINERLIHASNHEEMVPVLQELDSLSNRNPGVLNQFSQNLNPLLHSENESCRTLAFSLILKHATYCPGGSKVYLESILQLLQDENAHLRDTMIDKIHEFVILAQESGEEILTRMFQLGVSSNHNFLHPITKSMALLRNYSALP